ncbi:MAG: hypothetical protein JWM57_3831 [Phycisphaerales bacterium]|nr:hypothetical protein [Phycisphaerales bacterium]
MDSHHSSKTFRHQLLNSSDSVKPGTSNSSARLINCCACSSSVRLGKTNESAPSIKLIMRPIGTPPSRSRPCDSREAIEIDSSLRSTLITIFIAIDSNITAANHVDVCGSNRPVHANARSAKKGPKRRKVLSSSRSHMLLAIGKSQLYLRSPSPKPLSREYKGEGTGSHLAI